MKDVLRQIPQDRRWIRQDNIVLLDSGILWLLCPCNMLNPVLILDRGREALRGGKRHGFWSSWSNGADPEVQKFMRKSRHLKRAAFQLDHQMLRKTSPTDSAYSGAMSSTARLMRKTRKAPRKGWGQVSGRQQDGHCWFKRCAWRYFREWMVGALEGPCRRVKGHELLWQWRVSWDRDHRSKAHGILLCGDSLWTLHLENIKTVF